MAEDDDFENIWDLDHDPDLAEALGNLLIVWAGAETQMVWTFAAACDMDINRAHDAFYQIPTFDSRTKVLRAALATWRTKKCKPAEITKVIARLSRLSKTRNSWVHGAWMRNDAGDKTAVVNFRSTERATRGKLIKSADVENHLEAVREQIQRLSDLVPQELFRLDPDEP